MKMYLKLNEFYFLLGLVLYTVGQFLIFIFYNDIEALHSQEPIDFAHWFMLIGVLLLIPQIGNFPKSKWNYISSPTLILGIGLIIGMCVLDFVFWSLKEPELKRQVTEHLINTPEIWKPFMKFNGLLFNLGLLTSSFCYYQNSKTGTLLVLIGTLAIYIGGGWINVLGYILLTIGFYINFTDKNKS
jgi:hypothetical protein